MNLPNIVCAIKYATSETKAHTAWNYMFYDDISHL